eukprot:COSAG02_NODE_6601_length_3469_cov_1.869436_1_plen_100_part_10
MGVSWAGSNGEVKGQFVTAAIGLHNTPEGMTVAPMMIPVSTSRARRSHFLAAGRAATLEAQAAAAAAAQAAAAAFAEAAAAAAAEKVLEQQLTDLERERS